MSRSADAHETDAHKWVIRKDRTRNLWDVWRPWQSFPIVAFDTWGKARDWTVLDIDDAPSWQEPA